MFRLILKVIKFIWKHIDDYEQHKIDDEMDYRNADPAFSFEPDNIHHNIYNELHRGVENTNH